MTFVHFPLLSININRSKSHMTSWYTWQYRKWKTLLMMQTLNNKIKIFQCFFVFQMCAFWNVWKRTLCGFPIFFHFLLWFVRKSENCTKSNVKFMFLILDMKFNEIIAHRIHANYENLNVKPYFIYSSCYIYNWHLNW